MGSKREPSKYTKTEVAGILRPSLGSCTVSLILYYTGQSKSQTGEEGKSTLPLNGGSGKEFTAIFNAWNSR